MPVVVPVLTWPPCALPTGDNDTRDDAEAPSSLQPQQQQLVPSLQIPKNRSTGNLGSLNDPADKAGHSRFSFVADSSLHPALSPEYDPRLSRSAAAWLGLVDSIW